VTADPEPLRAGDVRLDLDGADLRGLVVGDGGAVLVQRIYPAFRDDEWRSAPVVVEHCEVRAGARAFSLELEGSARLGELDAGWRAVASGAADGTVRYALDVEARAAFRARRIGLCVHLDADACVGARARAGRETLLLGDAILPQRLRGEDYLPILGPFTRLEIAHAGGARTLLDTGATPFELEDQRNWADASFKAYSSGPPRAVPFARGDRVRQEVSVRLRAAGAPPASRAARPREVVVEPPADRVVPPIGVGELRDPLPRDAEEPPAARPSARPREVVVEPPAGRVVPPIGVGELRDPLPRGVAPAHVRLDVRLGSPTPPPELAHVEAAVARGAAVELAVHGDTSARPVLPARVRALPLARVLALDPGERTTTRALARHVRAAVGPGPVLVAGTAGSFSEVCRRPPARSGPAHVCWSACPQVHATDDRSVIENLPALAAQVRAVAALGGGLHAHVSLLRLAPPGVEDPRARAPFGAAWAVGALARLLGEDVATITLAPGGAPSAVLTAAADLMAAHGEPLRPVDTGGEAQLAALAWGAAAPTLLLANLSPEPRRATIRLPGATAATLAAVGTRRRTPRAAGATAPGAAPATLALDARGRAELALGPWAALRLGPR
jgi:D-apionolactonase